MSDFSFGEPKSNTGLIVTGILAFIFFAALVFMLADYFVGFISGKRAGYGCDADDDCMDGLVCKADPKDSEKTICQGGASDCPECGPEPSADTCKDFCDCPECGPEPSADTCKDFCDCPECGPEPSADTCKDFCDCPESGPEASVDTCGEFCMKPDLDKDCCPPGYNRNFRNSVKVAAKCDKDTQRCERCIADSGTAVPDDWPNPISKFTGVWVTDSNCRSK